LGRGSSAFNLLLCAVRLSFMPPYVNRLNTWDSPFSPGGARGRRIFRPLPEAPSPPLLTRGPEPRIFQRPPPLHTSFLLLSAQPRAAAICQGHRSLRLYMYLHIQEGRRSSILPESAHNRLQLNLRHGLSPISDCRLRRQCMLVLVGLRGGSPGSLSPPSAARC
jgi:hypothetical protein